MVVGYGVVDGVCSAIGGCNMTDGLFDSMAACEISCGTVGVGGITTMTNAGYVSSFGYPMAAYLSASLVSLSFIFV